MVMPGRRRSFPFSFSSFSVAYPTPLAFLSFFLSSYHEDDDDDERVQGRRGGEHVIWVGSGPGRSSCKDSVIRPQARVVRAFKLQAVSPSIVVVRPSVHLSLCHLSSKLARRFPSLPFLNITNHCRIG